MKEYQRGSVFEQIVKSRRRWITTVYEESEDKHLAWVRNHQRGFGNFIKTLDEAADYKDPAVVVLYANILGIIARFPIADVASSSTRKLMRKQRGGVEEIKRLGRVIYTASANVID